MARPNIGALVADKTRLREEIAKVGTQQEVARAAGRSPRTITKLLNDALPTATHSTFRSLAKVLGVGVREIVSGIYMGQNDDGVPIIVPFEENEILKEMWPGLGGKGSLLDGLGKLIRLQQDSLTDIEGWREEEPQSGTPKQFEHIREYWETELTSGELVSIRGCLSTFAPLVIGRPSGKRNLHHAYRAHQESGGIAGELVDANMAVTAGQLVWRPGSIGTFQVTWHCLGLYHSIVRNSIPIYVVDSVFRSQIEPSLHGAMSYAAEAEVIGRVARISGFVDAINLQQWRDFVLPQELDAQPFGIFVTGQHGTRVAVEGETRCLDGDIFTVVRHDGNLQLVTRFLDLSYPEGVHAETSELLRNAETKGDQIVFRYDDLDELKKRNAISSVSQKESIGRPRG